MEIRTAESTATEDEGEQEEKGQEEATIFLHPI